MKLKITKPIVKPKAWGSEIWIHNDEKYCGKILNFKCRADFSYHFHVKKTETWYVLMGTFELKTVDTDTAQEFILNLKPGDVIHIEPGIPHKLTNVNSMVEGRILEVSTQHFEEDSYRIGAGDSQRMKGTWK